LTAEPTGLKVVLRPFAEGDRERILVWRNSPDVAAQMFSDDVISPEQHREWFDRVRKSREQRYWLVERSSSPVGVANLSEIDSHHLRCEWAYYIGEIGARGQSTPGMIEYGVLDHAFGRLGMRKVSCQVLITNSRVAHLHRQFGFRDEGLLRAHILKNGIPVDVLLLALLREEWLERRGVYARLFADSVTVIELQ
jgi:UDP-4-amino-4,6-dideoxy-N-acetyl-beta-L-altrosamine N-acetyltransferase